VRPLAVHPLQEPQVRRGVPLGVRDPHLGDADRHPREAVGSNVEEIGPHGRHHTPAVSAFLPPPRPAQATAGGVPASPWAIRSATAMIVSVGL
jgi:hypothetical protein